MPDWDKRYQNEPDGLFGTKPNEYVRQILSRSDFSAQSALCLADGDGRNSRWLCQQGIKTTSLDLSKVAVANALTHDQNEGVMVDRIIADVATWSPPSDKKWDAVFLLYLQAPFTTRKAAIEKGLDALRPKGWFILEAFAKPQENSDFGPRDTDLLYDLFELDDIFEGQDILEALSGRVHLDQGKRHQGLASVIQFCCRKR